MAHPGLANCLCCGNSFQPDVRNARRQKYCSQLACRQASKAASQQAWLALNPDYFRGPENVARVQCWRAAHPQYWRRNGPRKARKPAALQDVCNEQEAIELPNESPTCVHPAQAALQDVLLAQPALLIGVIARLEGSALQDEIARTSRQLLKLGQDILAGRVVNVQQTSHLSRAGP